MKKAHVRTIALPLFALVLVITTVLLAQTGDSIWRISSDGEIVPSSSPLQRSALVVFREPAFSPTAAFTPGNLAVFVVAASQTNTGGAIMELNTNTASQTPGNVISILGVGTPDALRFSGSGTSTCYLSRTNDQTLLTFTGVNSTNTTSNTNILNPRAVGTLDSAGTFAMRTTYTGTSGNQTRASTSLNNTSWFISDQGGIYTNGSSSASPSANPRNIRSFGGTVYTGQASSSPTTAQIATVSAPSGGTITGLPGLTNNANLQDFYLISSGSNGSTYDILYVL